MHTSNTLLCARGLTNSIQTNNARWIGISRSEPSARALVSSQARSEGPIPHIWVSSSFCGLDVRQRSDIRMRRCSGTKYASSKREHFARFLHAGQMFAFGTCELFCIFGGGKQRMQLILTAVVDGSCAHAMKRWNAKWVWRRGPRCHRVVNV